MLGQLNLVVWAWIESVKDLRRGVVWGPFVVFALAQALVLLAVTQFYQPVLSWLVTPVLKLMGGGQLLHYPVFFVALPGFFSRINLFMDWLPGAFIFGVSYLLIYRLASQIPTKGTWSDAGRSFWALLALRLPIILLVLLSSWALPRLLGTEGGEVGGTALRTVRYGGFLLGVLVEALFLYAPLAKLVKGRSLWGSFGEALRLAGRVPVATFLVVLVPNLVQLPMAAAARRSESVVTRLAPEVVGWILLASVLVYLGANYLVVASAVRVYGARSGVGRGE